MEDQELFKPLIKARFAAEKRQSMQISFWQGVYIRFSENRLAVFALGYLFVLLLLAIIAPMLSPYSYKEQFLDLKNQAPSLKFFFGTDDLGRDLFTRIFYGARISLFVGICAAVIDLLLGVLWGGFAGFLGGWIDELMMRVVDILASIPHLLIVIVLMLVMGSGLLPIIVAMTITGWLGMARMVRGQVIQITKQDYVLAAKALGAGYRRILFKHVIPNIIGPIIVTVTLTIPTAIFVEAFLSFLGLGIQAPASSWGTLASEGLPAMRYYPWRVFFPALFISISMLSFNIVGDALRDSLDPRIRR
jgi:oligopeptide transport system permease protein